MGLTAQRIVGDKMVEQAHTIEQVDPQTRISKTDYRLGWPARLVQEWNFLVHVNVFWTSADSMF